MPDALAQHRERAMLRPGAFERGAQQRFHETRRHDVARQRVRHAKHRVHVQCVHPAPDGIAGAGIEYIGMRGLQLAHLCQRPQALPCAQRMAQIGVRGDIVAIRMEARRILGCQRLDLCKAMPAACVTARA